MSNVHPTAIVDPSATIADTAEIGPYCVVGPRVTVRQRTSLLNHVTIQSDTILGESNVVYPYSVIGADPQDRKYDGERTECEIGDRNIIREHVTIHRGTSNGGGITRIGSDNLIMVAAHVAHDCIISDHVTIANQVMIAGHVRIEEGATIGGGAGIHHFTTVGACSFIGGLARIAKDVPPYMMVEGNPAEVRGINAIGMQRSEYLPSHIEAMKDAYKRLYRSNGSVMAEKLDELRRIYPEVEAVTRLCAALAAAGDGVHGRALEVHRTDDKRHNV